MAGKYYGLCEACEHDAACTLRRSTRLEIIECEEFLTRPSKEETESLMERPDLEPVDAAQFGICINCMNVTTCSFPSARCGVIQCEEYTLDEAEKIPPAQSGYSRSAA